MFGKYLKLKIKFFLNRFRYFYGMSEQLEMYQNLSWRPPGHFYSPVLNVEEILKRKEKIFKNTEIVLPGIELNIKEQLELLDFFSRLKEIPFTPKGIEQFRYYYENKYFTYSDGFFLKSFLLYFRPKRIIEVGSGFSSALMVDLNENEFSRSIDITLIEPFPENRLNKLIRESDKVTIIKEFVQDLDLNIFKELGENDILFIDSSHVFKTGSDLNFLFFEVFPILSRGVIVHIHDIFYPFEYPIEWVLEKRSWNEIYFLRAFLIHNPEFKILIFNSFLGKFFEKEMLTSSNLLTKESGSSLWIQKV